MNTQLADPRRFWAKVDRRGPDECWPWTADRKARGYGRFMLDGKVRNASRVAYELLVGPIPEGLFVCHRCDNPPCVNPAHLFVATHLENNADMRRKGRGPNVKLTEAQVIEIRALRADGATLTAIGARYGVCMQAVWDVVNRSWRHV